LAALIIENLDHMEKMAAHLDQEVARWDERFFQLSKDILSRTIVTTGSD